MTVMHGSPWERHKQRRVLNLIPTLDSGSEAGMTVMHGSPWERHRQRRVLNLIPTPRFRLGGRNDGYGWVSVGASQTEASPKPNPNP